MYRQPGRRGCRCGRTRTELSTNGDHLRYPSDVTDEEWKHLEPLVPPAKRGGRKRDVDTREVLNRVMYVLGTGCQWRYIPNDLPPKARWIVISAPGGMTLRWIASITCWTSNAARNANVKPAPRRASLIARRIKSAEKGGCRLIRTALTRARDQR